jgi:membrane protein DedA with SNARE-associated domain
VFAYFVPGIRHLAALLAGAANLPLNVFALYAYVGALLWSTTFIAVGYGFGEEWRRFSPVMHGTVVIVAVAILLALIVGLLIMRRQSRTG